MNMLTGFMVSLTYRQASLFQIFLDGEHDARQLRRPAADDEISHRHDGTSCLFMKLATQPVTCRQAGSRKSNRCFVIYRLSIATLVQAQFHW